MPEKIDRPLSPHLQIYRPQLTSVMSIFHRFTGFGLAVGTLMVIWLLLAASFGRDEFATFSTFAGSGLGKFLIFGWSVALYYHMCNGVRHLLWDTGRLFKIETAYKAGYVVLAATAALTVLTWWFACAGEM